MKIKIKIINVAAAAIRIKLTKKTKSLKTIKTRQIID